MNVQQMRLYISQNAKYKSDEWTERVTNMPDNQVIAIYNKFKLQEMTTRGMELDSFNKNRVAAGYWKCDSCDLKGVCNIFEEQNKKQSNNRM